MKTLLFTIEYPPFKGGVASYYGSLVKYWPDKITVLKTGLTLPGLGFVYYFFLLLRRFNYSHIIVGNIFPLAFPAMVFSRLFKKKFIVVLHGLDFSLAKKRRSVLSKKILAAADKIICANSQVARDVEDFRQEDQKTRVVNPGAEMGRGDGVNYRKEYGAENKLVLLTLGRLTKRKGVDVVLQIWPSLKKEAPNLVYLVAGDGSDRKYLESLAEGLEDVKFLGEISEAQKWSLLSLCDIFIMPARNLSGDYEGFGIVYLEANLCAKPVIAGESGGVADAVISGYNGLLVDPEDPADIKQAVLRLIQDSEERRILGQQGQQRAQDDFQWSKISQTFYNIISK